MEIQPLGLAGPRAAIAPNLLPPADDSLHYVCVGETIEAADETTLRGHGTQVVDDQLVATVCGVVEKVNKLMTVRVLRSRYSAEIGDVVVGRVTEVGSKRWHVDLSSRQEAQLLLSAVTLPGGVQRRRTAEDELSMRQVFQEGDLISAEVQALHHDGVAMLHTRSSKYGRLSGGQVVRVPSELIKRQKLHFQHLEAAGVNVIFGCNGLVWVAPQAHLQEIAGEQQRPQPLPSLEQRAAVARVAQATAALAELGLMVHGASILEVVELAVRQGVAVRMMLGSGFLAQIAAREEQRRAVPMQH